MEAYYHYVIKVFIMLKLLKIFLSIKIPVMEIYSNNKVIFLFDEIN